MSLSRIKDRQSGQMIITVVIFALIIMVAVSSLVGYAMLQIQAQRQAVGRTLGLSIAEAAVESAIWKLNNQPGYNGESGTGYNGGVYNITLTTLGNSKIIRAEAFVPDAAAPKAKRVVQVTATTGTTNYAFNYGVQVGDGGLEMSNSSRVIGNVYSNGNIVGTNSARISGTAIVAGPAGIIDGMDVDENSWAYRIQNNSAVGGNATHAILQNTSVGGNVVADSIASCSVGGNATYDTRSSCSVGGSATTPNPNPFVPAEVLPLPISEAQIDLWEQEAAAGGVVSTQSYSSGSRTLGPKKINGNLILNNTAEVVVTGTLWVTGEIRLSNSAILRLDPSFGAAGGVVLAGIDESSANGYIEINNSAQTLGSGTAGSYLLLLSQREGLGSTAIAQTNGSGSAILYAGEGLIALTNSSAMKEITARKLRISNSATVTYESGLANAQFTSGPAGGWEVLFGTWQLLQ